MLNHNFITSSQKKIVKSCCNFFAVDSLTRINGDTFTGAPSAADSAILC